MKCFFQICWCLAATCQLPLLKPPCRPLHFNSCFSLLFMSYYFLLRFLRFTISITCIRILIALSKLFHFVHNVWYKNSAAMVAASNFLQWNAPWGTNFQLSLHDISIIRVIPPPPPFFFLHTHTNTSVKECDVEQVFALYKNKASTPYCINACSNIRTFHYKHDFRSQHQYLQTFFTVPLSDKNIPNIWTNFKQF